MSDSKLHEVDARETFCPVPIMRLAKQIKAAAVGDVVRVRATDQGFEPDVRAWCKGTKHELLSLREHNGEFIAEIRKTH